MRLDARKSLDTLKTEWEHCTKCSLGSRRQQYSLPYVAGEGAKYGIMIIGDSPGDLEEQTGRPHVGFEGIIRTTIHHFNAMDITYFTHITPCRSCKAVLGPDGSPFMIKQQGVPVPKFQDQGLLTAQLAACTPRLFEEIYIVDPLVIVALGHNVASVLAGRRMIATDVGKDFTVRVPGMGRIAVRTKNGAWKHPSRKGADPYPTQRNEVLYTGILSYPPYLTIQSKDDMSDKSPVRETARHIKLAVQIYKRMTNLLGIIDTTAPIPEDEE